MPCHLRDMNALKDVVPDLDLQFKDGKFVLRQVSGIRIDQAHEQNNGMVKGEGGAVGLTENPSALRWWMAAGPEMARAINEFEDSMTTEP